MDWNDYPIPTDREKDATVVVNPTPVFTVRYDIADEFMQGDTSWRRPPVRGSFAHARVADIVSTKRIIAFSQTGAHPWPKAGFEKPERTNELYHIEARPWPSWHEESDTDLRLRLSDYQGLSAQFYMGTRILKGESSLQKEIVKKEIFGTKSHDRVIEILSENGMERHVEDYHASLRHQSKISGKAGFILQSLQSWARFVIDFAEEENLPHAKIRSDRDGCVQLEWRLLDGEDGFEFNDYPEYFGNGRGIIDLTFYPSYLHSLSVLSGPYKSKSRRISLAGRLPYSLTITILRFIQRKNEECLNIV